MFEKQVYEKRRAQIKGMLKNGIGLFLGNTESPMNYTDNTYRFRQDSTFLYFFGIDSPGFAAIIDFESGNEIIFGNDADIDDIIWMGNQISVADRAARVGVLNVQPFTSLAGFLNNVINQGRKIHYLPPYRHYNILLLNSLLGIKTNRIKDYPSLELTKAVINCRSVKDEHEISEIEKACQIGYQMHVTAMNMAIEGNWEYNVAGTIEGIALNNGGCCSFPVICSQNGQILHNHDHSQMLKNNRLLIVDAGAETNMHYASDFTRTIPVGGKFTNQQKDVYQIVLDANNAAAAAARPGITYQQVHLMACKIIAQGLINLGIMKGNADDAVNEGAHALFMPHGLGHMMGLDVHDMEDLGQIYVGYDDKTRPGKKFGLASLRMGRELEPGFVITNEPGIYFIPALIDKWKAEKINNDFINFDKLKSYLDFGGIRLEDDLLITQSGCRLLGKRIPVNINDVESEVGK